MGLDSTPCVPSPSHGAASSSVSSLPSRARPLRAPTTRAWPSSRSVSSSPGSSNSLYAQSAAASERLNGATYELAQAKRALSQQRHQAAGARKKLDVQKEVVAELTVEQLMSGSTTARVTTMLDGDGTQDLLDRASAYESTDEAMNARIDDSTRGRSSTAQRLVGPRRQSLRWARRQRSSGRPGLPSTTPSAVPNRPPRRSGRSASRS